jgi:hypothetical protein
LIKVILNKYLNIIIITLLCNIVYNMNNNVQYNNSTINNRYTHNTHNTHIINNIYKNRNIRINNERTINKIYGLVLFLLLFTCILPYFLLKLKNTFVMLYYFSNLDLIANILNHWDAYFSGLYVQNPTQVFEFMSVTIINFIALFGISSMVATLTLKHNNVYYGVAAASTALLITYLLPTTLIYLLMTRLEKYLYSIFIYSYNISEHVSLNLSNIITVFIGIVCSGLCVYSEVLLSKTYLGKIANIYKYIHAYIKYIS